MKKTSRRSSIACNAIHILQSLARRIRSVILFVACDASSGFAYNRLHVSTLRPTATSGARVCMQKPCELTKIMYAEIPASSVTLPTFAICIQPDGVSRLFISAKSLGSNAWAYRTDLPAIGRICIQAPALHASCLGVRNATRLVRVVGCVAPCIATQRADAKSVAARAAFAHKSDTSTSLRA